MPKSRTPRRSQQPAVDPPEAPPDRAEVERAIEAVLDRLTPRPARGASETKAPVRGAGRPLARLPGSDG